MDMLSLFFICPHRPHIIIVTYPYRTGIKIWILGLDTYIFSSNYLDDSIKLDSRNKVFID